MNFELVNLRQAPISYLSALNPAGHNTIVALFQRYAPKSCCCASRYPLASVIILATLSVATIVLIFKKFISPQNPPPTAASSLDLLDVSVSRSEKPFEGPEDFFNRLKCREEILIRLSTPYGRELNWIDFDVSTEPGVCNFLEILKCNLTGNQANLALDRAVYTAKIPHKVAEATSLDHFAFVYVEMDNVSTNRDHPTIEKAELRQLLEQNAFTTIQVDEAVNFISHITETVSAALKSMYDSHTFKRMEKNVISASIALTKTQSLAVAVGNLTYLDEKNVSYKVLVMATLNANQSWDLNLCVLSSFFSGFKGLHANHLYPKLNNAIAERTSPHSNVIYCFATAPPLLNLTVKKLGQGDLENIHITFTPSSGVTTLENVNGLNDMGFRNKLFCQLKDWIVKNWPSQFLFFKETTYISHAIIEAVEGEPELFSCTVSLNEERPSHKKLAEVPIILPLLEKRLDIGCLLQIEPKNNVRLTQIFLCEITPIRSNVWKTYYTNVYNAARIKTLLLNN
jgi:hypothetical protein